MSTLDHAIQIAAKAHQDQEYEPGVPYILHPLRVMLAMKTDEERMAAVLHDVVERTKWSLKELEKEGFSREVVEAVDHLTKRAGEPYEAYIERVRPHALARAVKLADLRDNLEQCRYPNPTDKDRKSAEKYEAAIARLSAC